MVPRPDRHIAAFAVAAVAAATLAACGGADKTSSGGGATTKSSKPASSGAASVTVTETEFAIKLSEPNLKAGAHTFNVMNQGKFPHNLVVKGPGVAGKASPTVQGGQSGELTVTLQKGSYELWCGVDGHKDKGMDMTVKVS
jgi:uncharacterized cupredoxin-like copper-binding protein